MRKKLLGSLGWATIDTLGRLALLTASTAVFSRLLSPHDFGITALVLIVVTVASVFVGTPFEEALAQRRCLRRPHLQAALAVAWLAGLALLGFAVPLGWLMAQLYGEPQIAAMLPVAMLSIFFSGHADIVTGLARRLHRFNDVSIASLAGHAIGIALSVIMVLVGFGVWALIGQRLLVVVARALVLQWRIGFLISPRWSRPHLDGFGRFASLSLMDRLMDNLTYLAFNSLVGINYGVTTLGHVNMAMRLIEPIRGAIAATGHNLAFSYFAASQTDPARLQLRAQMVVSRASLAIAPVFIGLAAIMPILLPLVVGPGWDEAVSIAICLAIGSAIIVPARLIFTALSAMARPEFSLMANLSSFLVTLLVLVAAAGLGPISVGLSRIAGDAMQMAIAIGLSSSHLLWQRRKRLGALLPGWILAGLMGAIVIALRLATPDLASLPALALSIITGLGVYGGFIACFARSDFSSLWAFARPTGTKTATSKG